MASNPHDDAIYSTADDRKSRAHTGNDDMLYDTSDTGGQPQPYKMQPMEMGGSDGLDQPLIAHGRHRESSAPLRYGSHHVWLSHVLVFLNIVCFFIEMSVNKWEFAPLSQNFLFGPSVTGLIKAGAQTSFCIKDQNQGWRLVTAAFLHGGILHLLFNMYALSVIAPFLERDFGALKLFFLYFGAGCSAALATALMLPNTVSVGASGAICGLLGALWAELLMNCGNSHNAKSGINQNKFCQLLFNTILLLAMSLLPDVNVSVSMHLCSNLTPAASPHLFSVLCSLLRHAVRHLPWDGVHHSPALCWRFHARVCEETNDKLSGSPRSCWILRCRRAARVYVLRTAYQGLRPERILSVLQILPVHPIVRVFLSREHGALPKLCDRC
jgi:membrane associated rhomboid family serine protease